MIPVQVGRGAVAEFVYSRLAEDEADPGLRYADPDWGLRLVAILRHMLANDPSPDTYRTAAAVWADHPEFRPGWRG